MLLCLIVAIGMTGALLAGLGKHLPARPAASDAAITASVNGQRVPLGGPAVAMFERGFSGTGSKQHAAATPRRAVNEPDRAAAKAGD